MAGGLLTLLKNSRGKYEKVLMNVGNKELQYLVKGEICVAKGKVEISEKYCKGCGLCLAFCPQKILQLDKNKITANGYNPCVVTDADKCIGCCSCAKMCPDAAISVRIIG